MNNLDSPENILSAWIALETLSPQSFKKPEDLCEGNKDLLVNISEQEVTPYKTEPPYPYNQSDKDGENRWTLFYHIIIGSINLDRVNNLLINHFDESYFDRRINNGYSPIAVLTVNSEGKLVHFNSIVTSSFAWAYPKVLKGEIRRLNDWEEESKRIEEDLKNYILTMEGENKSLLNYTHLKNILKWLVENLAIKIEHVDLQFFAIKKYVYNPKDKEPTPPEPPLLNSFFINDLNKAKSLLDNSQANELLKYYLGIKKPLQKYDLLKDQAKLSEILSPLNMPLGRWPAVATNSLVVLQQSVVNLRKALKEERILAVNGPPGTGKTTLLKDIIADLITERAIKLAEFNNPNDAFKFRKKVELSNAWFNSYELDNKITGYEVLIASSNNNAVENISKELPSLNSIDPDLVNELKYFHTISEELLSKNSAGEKQDNEYNSWGIISAALGNSSNRSNFKKNFWDDNDIGLRNYLKACLGQKVHIKTFDPKSNQYVTKAPKTIIECDPPNSAIKAQKKWKDLREEFIDCIKNLEKKLHRLAKYELAHQEINKLNKELQNNNSSLIEIDNTLISLKTKLEITEQQISKINNILQEYDIKLKHHWSIKPGWINRFLDKKKFAWWSEIESILYKSSKANYLKHNELLEAVPELKQKVELLQKDKQLLEFKISNLSKAIIEQQEIVNEATNVTVIDKEFWKKDHDEIHQTAAWLDEDIQKERSNIFILAMRIHKSFIENAAKPIRHNLGLLMSILTNESISDKDEVTINTALWQTLFLITPAISSTFASIERMFKNISYDALGWLIVDEAGQATPQSVVGSMIRAKRAIIVGDPMQIEPVVTLPSKLTSTICNEFSIQPKLWNAPVASIQTCADLASPYGTKIERNDITWQIGIPLLVHRRCDNPMFKLSNHLAYNNLMVHGIKSEQFSQIKSILGATSWYDINHTISAHKWSEEEGKTARTLVETIVQRLGKDPDIYIITPFREISYHMKQFLLRNPTLSSKLFSNPYEWINNRIGTIHTFQGKEAEGVILLLGAQGPHNEGARNWAGNKINIINVAVTRAKNVLYVIGSFKDWHQCGYFNSLATHIPLRRL